MLLDYQVQDNIFDIDYLNDDFDDYYQSTHRRRKIVRIINYNFLVGFSLLVCFLACSAILVWNYFYKSSYVYTVNGVEFAFVKIGVYEDNESALSQAEQERLNGGAGFVCFLGGKYAVLNDLFKFGDDFTDITSIRCDPFSIFTNDIDSTRKLITQLKKPFDVLSNKLKPLIVQLDTHQTSLYFVKNYLTKIKADFLYTINEIEYLPQNYTSVKTILMQSYQDIVQNLTDLLQSNSIQLWQLKHFVISTLFANFKVYYDIATQV
ncbi:MAG: hypothetical protein LBU60_05630 [Clostridiales bacterium]|jgi:hypothetical protein|nr:hypothetical protein [Clostridiales bacterium]